MARISVIAERTGYSESRVRELLDDKYKIKTAPKRETTTVGVSESLSPTETKKKPKAKKNRKGVV